MLRAKVQHVVDLTALIQTETIIGAPATVLRMFDSGDRITELRRLVHFAATVVGNWRSQEVAPVRGLLQRLAAIDTPREAFARASFDQRQGSMYVPLGGGNRDTKIGLWVSSDVNGIITDRCVVKDVCFDQDVGKWNDPLMWQNPEDPLSKTLTEAHVMRRLQDTRSQNVVRLRNWQLHNVQLVARVSQKLQ